MTAKMMVSLRPITQNAQAVTPMICRSIGMALMCRNPAVTSRRNEPREPASGADSRTRMVASATIAAAKVTASMMATASPVVTKSTWSATSQNRRTT